MESDPLVLHIEVRQKSESSLSSEEIELEVDKYLNETQDIVLDAKISGIVMPSHVEYLRFCCDSGDKYQVNICNENIVKSYHIYQAWQEGPQVDSLETEFDEVPAYLNWCLPNVAFEGLWESLILESGVKEQLMSYVQTTLLYSSKQVNAQIIHWNGVVLLHGPPGTGKTSLCKSLAQKLSIQLNCKYKTSQLIEINTHSLFSKWFSESAKLVLKMFSSVKQWLESPDHFVCILVDEVESLTHMRRASDIEPSDSIRVVNAVLTQIDQLQRYPNVLILATSNVTGIIDVAFADRADLKLFIPYPSEWGIYEILRSCILELINCNLINGNANDFFECYIFKKLISSDNQCAGDAAVMREVMEKSDHLRSVSNLCSGLSGRTLRKIPFLTSTKFVNKSCPSVETFLQMMGMIVRQHKSNNDKFFNVKNGDFTISL